MILPIIIVITSLFLDGILSNFFPYMINDLSLFTPYFTIISLIIIYPFFQKKKRNYYILIVIIGYFYDLLYTNLFLADAIFFFLTALIITLIYQKLEINIFTNIFLMLLTIIIYHTLLALSLFIFNVVPITINITIYLITNSLLLNIIYGEILYLICKYLPHKRHLN